MTRLSAPLIAACVLLAPVSALGQESEDRTLMWRVRPDAQMFSLFYPPNALMQGVAGRVELQCTVRTNERADCVAASEQPDGWGFAEAAVAMSRSFRLLPAISRGRPIESQLRVPIRFLQMQEKAGVLGELDLPIWEDAPAPPRVREAWLQGGGADGVRARGVLSCRVSEERFLECDVVHESMPGAGARALALAPEFRVHPAEADFIARYREDRFTLPINFGFGPLYEPVSVVTDGVTPAEIAAPAEVTTHFYPAAARRAGVTGSATIMCVARASRGFDCALESETPEGRGFGAAAQEIAATLSAFAGELAGEDWPFLEGDRLRVLAAFGQEQAERSD